MIAKQNQSGQYEFMGLGITEILVIVIILLLFFGPNKPAAIFKSLGEGIRGFKRSLNDQEAEYKDVSEISDKERKN